MTFVSFFLFFFLFFFVRYPQLFSSFSFIYSIQLQLRCTMSIRILYLLICGINWFGPLGWMLSVCLHSPNSIPDHIPKPWMFRICERAMPIYLYRKYSMDFARSQGRGTPIVRWNWRSRRRKRIYLRPSGVFAIMVSRGRVDAGVLFGAHGSVRLGRHRERVPPLAARQRKQRSGFS